MLTLAAEPDASKNIFDAMRAIEEDEIMRNLRPGVIRPDKQASGMMHHAGGHEVV